MVVLMTSLPRVTRKPQPVWPVSSREKLPLHSIPETPVKDVECFGSRAEFLRCVLAASRDAGLPASWERPATVPGTFRDAIFYPSEGVLAIASVFREKEQLFRQADILQGLDILLSLSIFL